MEQRLLICLLICLLALILPATALPAAPAWWASKGVTGGGTASDYAAANQGQLKNMATKARDYFNETLPGGAGPTINTLVDAWSAPTSNTSDYSALNQGQLKTVAKPFYDRLIALGIVTGYPWTATPSDDQSYAIANLGQLKNVFAFDFSSASYGSYNTDADHLPDAWERTHFGDSLSQGDAGDFDGDGVSNLQEFLNGTNPEDFFNGEVPVLEIISGNNQEIDPETITPQPFVVKIKHSNGTAWPGAPVTFRESSGAVQMVQLAVLGSARTETVTLTADANGFASNSTASAYYSAEGVVPGRKLIEARAKNSLAALPAQFTVTARGLIDRWQLDTTTVSITADTGPGNNPGTLTNSPVSGPGIYGNGLIFSGTNDLVAMGSPSNGSLDLGSSSFSVSTWFKIGPAATGSMRLVTKGHWGWTGGYMLGMGHGTPGTLCFGIGTHALFATTTTYNDDKWHQVVGVFDRSSLKARIYVDGMPQSLSKIGSFGTVSGTEITFAGSDTLTASNPAWPLYLGGQYEPAYSVPYQDQFQGSLDDVRIYLGALNASAITALQDGDNDGLSDGWEMNHFGNLEGTGQNDSDGDGISDHDEFANGSDPNDYFNGQTPVVEILWGTPQSAVPGAFGPDDLVVKVHHGDMTKTPYVNAPVVYSVTGGSLALADRPDPNAVRWGSLERRTNVQGRVYRVYAQVPGAVNTSHTIVVGAKGKPVAVTYILSAKSTSPSAPTNLRAWKQEKGGLVLFWTDTSDNEDGFKLEQSTDNGVHWSVVVTTDFNKHRAEMPAPAGSTVSFRVRAFNNLGLSGPSNEVAYDAIRFAGGGSGGAGGNDDGTNSDEDRLTDVEEIEIGTDPEASDTDNDGNRDDADGWPLEKKLSPPRLPKTGYALIDLKTTEETGYAASVNSKGVVVSQKGCLWIDGEWSEPVEINTPDRFSYREGVPQHYSSGAINDSNHFLGEGFYDVANSPTDPGGGYCGFYEGEVLLLNNTSADNLANFVGCSRYSHTMSSANDINNAGLIVGSACNNGEWGTTLPAYRYATGKWTFIDIPEIADETATWFEGSQFVEGELLRVNEAGHMIGVFFDYRNDEDNSYYFYYDGTTVTRLPQGYKALGINEDDYVVLMPDNESHWEERYLWHKDLNDLINLEDSFGEPVGTDRMNSRLETVGIRASDGKQVAVINGRPVEISKLISDKWEVQSLETPNEAGIALAKVTESSGGYAMAFSPMIGSILIGGSTDPKDTMDIPAEIMVDANRDGQMSFTDPILHDRDTTSQDKPFRFWVNNDYDKVGAEVAGVQDDASPDEAHANYKEDSIPLERDLEDFVRLWIYIGGMQEAIADGKILVGLKWKNVTDGDPSIKIYQSVETDGGKNYLTTKSIAQNQILLKDAITFQNGQTEVKGTSAFIFPHNALTGIFHDLSPTNAKKYFLFEGCKKGKGQLVITFHKNDATNTEIGEAPGIYFDLKDIKEMYERWSVESTADQNGGAPLAAARLSPFRLPSGVAQPFQYNAQSPEEKKYILFVHGWNMMPYEKDAFAETGFKRLWHQGYKGRYAAFDWPDRYGFPWDDLSLQHYDESDWSAWRSAVPLADLLVQLNTACPGQVYTFAHSQGNVVLGEALRLNAVRPQPTSINTYVACEAALAGSFYDANLNNSHPMTFILNEGPETPDLMPTWLSPNSGGVGRKFNFYNENDSALGKFNWNMPLRPDSGWTSLGQKYYRVGTIPDGDMLHELDPGGPNDVRDRYEIYSFITEPRSLALGAIAPIPPAIDISIAGFQSTSSLRKMWPTDPGNHSGREWHSAQFRFTNMEQKTFWEKLMNAFQLPRVP